MKFETLITRIVPKLKSITYKLGNYLSAANSQDLFQEALLHLWQDYRQGKLSNKTDSYILQGCYFYLKNYIRKEKPGKKIFSLNALIGDKETKLEEILIYNNSDGQDYREHLNNKLLADAINNNGLTKKEKKILFLYADGLTTREIGNRFGISHVSVVKAMKLIRQKCKKHIDL
ncbi:MAG: sigma-70 family RNA polymerase sigma factor [Candidatus Omnitrophica bacterium]|nr:sigma-70 family RNA polymerase sigma factor [Candidatus Omnitrophota bacterium]